MSGRFVSASIPDANASRAIASSPCWWGSSEVRISIGGRPTTVKSGSVSPWAIVRCVSLSPCKPLPLICAGQPSAA